uniref:Uncharacterized protein n=1 Tax=Eutreptiella gymnastica TaxID=73025 RepID=A0A7S1N7G7_9EUGL
MADGYPVPSRVCCMSQVQVYTESDGKKTTGSIQVKADGARGLINILRSPKNVNSPAHNRKIRGCLHLLVLDTFVESPVVGDSGLAQCSPKKNAGQEIPICACSNNAVS